MGSTSLQVLGESIVVEARKGSGGKSKKYKKYGKRLVGGGSGSKRSGGITGEKRKRDDPEEDEGFGIVNKKVGQYLIVRFSYDVLELGAL